MLLNGIVFKFVSVYSKQYHSRINFLSFCSYRMILINYNDTILPFYKIKICLVFVYFEFIITDFF